MTAGIKKINENVITTGRSLTIVTPELKDNSNWQIGTLKCDPKLSGLKYKSSSTGAFSTFDARQTLTPNTVNSALIEDYTIVNIDLHDDCVENRNILDRTINHIKMQANTLTEAEMANNSVVNRMITDKCITDNKIADLTIQNRSLADNSIQLRNMCANSVGRIQILDGAVDNNKILINTITNDRLNDRTIQYNKIADYTIIGGEKAIVNGQTINGNIAQKTITNYNIADHTINELNIMTGAISNRTIGDEEVYGVKIKPLAIQTNHIDNRAVTSDKIGIEEVKTPNIASHSVTLEKLSNDVIDVLDNAVKYEPNGSVTMLKNGKERCDVTIGSGTVKNGIRNSNKNGSLNVYGDIQADRVYNMAYADLAEGYVPGEELKPGDVAFLREDGKVYRTTLNGRGYCVGVISDEYALCLGASDDEIKKGEKVAVALVGKVHVTTDLSTVLGQKVYSTLDNGCTFVGIALETKDLKDKKEHKVLTLVRPI